MADNKKITCPRCGVPMNHHAEKMDRNAESGVEVLIEIHACPKCGASVARPVSEKGSDNDSAK